MTFISQLKHLACLEETRHWALATKLAEHLCLAQNLRSFAILAEYKLYNLAVDIEVWLLNYCRAVLLSADAFRASLTGLSQFLLATIEEAWRWACLSTSQFLLAITEEARRWALNSFHLTGESPWLGSELWLLLNLSPGLG